MFVVGETRISVVLAGSQLARTVQSGPLKTQVPAAFRFFLNFSDDSPMKMKKFQKNPAIICRIEGLRGKRNRENFQREKEREFCLV